MKNLQTAIMNSKQIYKAKRIAFVAHDDKKTDLIEWSYFNRKTLMQHEIMAAGYAGSILEGTLNKPVLKLSSEHMGGFRQMISCITEGKIDMIFFFWKEGDNILDSDIKALLKAAIEANLVIACNRITADFILKSMLMSEEYFLPAQENVIKSPQTAFINKNAFTAVA